MNVAIGYTVILTVAKEVQFATFVVAISDYMSAGTCSGGIEYAGYRIHPWPAVRSSKW